MRRNDVRAQITHKGTVLLNGVEYKSLSSAAKSINGTSLNGWLVWGVVQTDKAQWIPLAVLREALRVHWYRPSEPGENGIAQWNTIQELVRHRRQMHANVIDPAGCLVSEWVATLDRALRQAGVVRDRRCDGGPAVAMAVIQVGTSMAQMEPAAALAGLGGTRKSSLKVIRIGCNPIL